MPRVVTWNSAGGPIGIERNPAGAPVISASDLAGAFEGLGYCHACDRALQMLLVRTLARGEAAQYLSSDDEFVRLDTFFRRLGLFRDIESEERSLPPDLRLWIEAYCRGVNRRFKTKRTPWELRLAGFPAAPPEWTFADIYLTGKLIGYAGLAQTQADIETFIVECVQHGISRDQLHELFPGMLEGMDYDLIKQVALDDPIVPKELFEALALPKAAASNGWAIAPTRSTTGRALIANDPHLELNRLPAVWYEVVMRFSREGQPWYAMGSTMPGTTALVTGRNPELAWGVTYAYMDCVDSWIEDCRDGTYLRGDERRAFRVRKETIRRKGKPPLELVIHENEHGVLRGDPGPPGYRLATRWSGAEGTGVASLLGFAKFLECTSADDARSIGGSINNSSWSWVFADRSGNIARQMSGNMPLRRAGASGLYPLPGWDPENDWRGFAAIDDLPRELNPECGVIAAANDDVNHLGKVHPINAAAADYRIRRIKAELSAKPLIAPEDCRALQLDLYSLQAERFLNVIRPQLQAKPDSAAARLLIEWDCRYDAGSRSAVVFERFYRDLLREVFGRDPVGSDRGGLGERVYAYLTERTGCLTEFFGAFDDIMLAERSAWFGNRSRDEIVEKALTALDSAPTTTYGESRTLTFQHLILGDLPLAFLGLNRGPFPFEGSRATVRQGQVHFPRARRSAFGPSYRMVADLGEDAMSSALPGGPSDRPFSRWYASGIVGWLAGDYVVTQGFPTQPNGPAQPVHNADQKPQP